MTYHSYGATPPPSSHRFHVRWVQESEAGLVTFQSWQPCPPQGTTPTPFVFKQNFF
jgi:hypothetical protein